MFLAGWGSRGGGRFGAWVFVVEGNATHIHGSAHLCFSSMPSRRAKIGTATGGGRALAGRTGAQGPQAASVLFGTWPREGRHAVYIQFLPFVIFLPSLSANRPSGPYTPLALRGKCGCSSGSKAWCGQGQEQGGQDQGQDVGGLRGRRGWVRGGVWARLGTKCWQGSRWDLSPPNP